MCYDTIAQAYIPISTTHDILYTAANCEASSLHAHQVSGIYFLVFCLCIMLRLHTVLSSSNVFWVHVRTPKALKITTGGACSEQVLQQIKVSIAAKKLRTRYILVRHLVSVMRIAYISDKNARVSGTWDVGMKRAFTFLTSQIKFCQFHYDHIRVPGWQC